MVSLRDKRIEHESLFQQEGAKYISTRYGEPTANNQAVGYDDMFPTIAESFYQHFPWKGTLLPGNGEVCSLYWDMVKDETSLTMSFLEVQGRRDREEAGLSSCHAGSGDL